MARPPLALAINSSSFALALLIPLTGDAPVVVNKYGDPSTRGRARRISTASLDKGTMCSEPFFARADGITPGSEVQVEFAPGCLEHFRPALAGEDSQLDCRPKWVAELPGTVPDQFEFRI